MTQSKSRRRCEKSATAFYKSGRDTQPGATVAASDEQSVTVPPSAARQKQLEVDRRRALADSGHVA